ncbi:MAG: FHA domain-containing protein [Planctomycetaceae bacterium]|nr:FHA domain-containing protein [Planctomycetaceae bacterium]
MSESAIHSLCDALRVSRPIRLTVGSQAQAQPEIVVIDSPFGLIGRSAGCHLVLTDRVVSYRHVYLQAFGDRVICIDLLSPHPIAWSDPSTAGWLCPGQTVWVGPNWIQLCDDGWSSDVGGWPSPLECRTRTDEHTPYGALPLVHLELLNQQFKGMSWPINRVLTLVGRDDRCRITCADESISRVHCSLLLTPYGLWVIDLLGRGGIRVNGIPCRCASLAAGDELSVGRYHMRAAYESAPKQLAPAHAAPIPPDTDEMSIVDDVLSAEQLLPSPEFLTRNNKIFPVTISSPVVIVEPRGGVRSFGYQEIQLESNIVTQLLKTRSNLSHVVVDIHRADAIDSIMINSIMAMCRAAKGRAAICNASDSMLSILSDMSLTRLWPHFPTREEALQHVSPDESSAQA